VSRIRLWDQGWNCLYDSHTSDLTPEQFMADHDWLNFSEDLDIGTRTTGRMTNVDGKIVRETDFAHLRKILTYPNPLFAEHWTLEDDPFDPSAWGLSAAPEPFPHLTGTPKVDAINRDIALQFQAQSREAWDRFERALVDGLTPHFKALAEAIAKAKPQLDALALVLDDDQPPPPRADGKPHPPKPSRKPPMWAHDPTRSRRKR
jgi:hypothetical protein